MLQPCSLPACVSGFDTMVLQVLCKVAVAMLETQLSHTVGPGNYDFITFYYSLFIHCQLFRMIKFSVKFTVLVLMSYMHAIYFQYCSDLAVLGPLMLYISQWTVTGVWCVTVFQCFMLSRGSSIYLFFFSIQSLFDSDVGYSASL